MGSLGASHLCELTSASFLQRHLARFLNVWLFFLPFALWPVVSFSDLLLHDDGMKPLYRVLNEDCAPQMDQILKLNMELWSLWYKAGEFMGVSTSTMHDV